MMVPGRAAALFLACSLYFGQAQTLDTGPGTLPELTRDARPSELITVLGQGSALLGHESGRFEAWAYPLKILHDFHLSVRIDGDVIPGDSLVRSITVRPESTTLLYAGDTFSIRETMLVPIDQPAALIRLEIETSEPLEVIATFQPDLQLEWPGAIGGTDVDWNPRLRAFAMTEPQERFEAVVGSPTAAEFVEPYPLDYAGPRETAFSLGVTPKGQDTKTIVIAGALGHPKEAEDLFRQLSSGFEAARQRAQQYYADYLKNHVQVRLPDPVLQEAFTWSEVSMVQALVKNPYLGSGLVAGFNTSGDDERPGFAWYFGRDSEWTSLALNAIGDFATSREAIDFLAHYQRADGKIPHEISQSASFVPWFTSIPFAWAAADATPLFIIATRDYVQESGDVEFARAHWDNLWRAYQFLVSTYGPEGLAQNVNAGHGWVEAGPLMPIRAELYQSGAGLEAVRSLAELAALLHKDDEQKQLTAEFDRKKPVLNQTFWVPEQQDYAIGVDAQGHTIDIPSVLASVPLWFGLLDAEKAGPMIERMANPDFETDWGMRIIPSSEPKYDPGGYHAGSVWPLFTGWASVGEYRYHRALAGYANLHANAELTWSGALGHVAEVLSGNYFQILSTGSPNQVWSAAMVAAPLLRGLFGLEADANRHTLTFAPHVPGDWTWFAIRNIRVGSSALDLSWLKTRDAVRLEVTQRGDVRCGLEFSPAVSLRAKVRRVLLNGRPIPFRAETNSVDQHVQVHVPAGYATETITIELSDNPGLTENAHLPLAGSESRGTRVIAERWSPQRDALYLEVAGPGDSAGELDAWDAEEIAWIEGASLVPGDADRARIDYHLPQANPNAEAHLQITIHFRSESKKRR